MNNYERGQFNFIMSLSEEEFDEWMMSIPDDDIQYALELIQLARAELSMHEYSMFDDLDKSDLSEARALLKKFQL